MAELKKKVNELTIFGPAEVADAASRIVNVFALLTDPHDHALPLFESEVQRCIEGYVAAAGQAVSGIGSPQESGNSATITA